MTNEQKGQLYDDYIRESEQLQRINSRIKSENAGNIPPHLQDTINKNEFRIKELVRKLENLFM